MNGCTCRPEVMRLSRRERRALGKEAIVVHAADCPLGRAQRTRPFGIARQT